MKKSILIVGAAIALLSSCGNNNKCNCSCSCSDCGCEKDSAAVAARANRGEYKIADKVQTDISNYPVDEDGYITLFDGKTLDGWRGYGMDAAPTSWKDRKSVV